MTKKQKKACKNEIKIWKWLAVRPQCTTSEYYEQFPEEFKKLKRFGDDAEFFECFLCGVFSPSDGDYSNGCNCCPLGHCNKDSLYYFLNKCHTVFSFLIADTVERALKKEVKEKTNEDG